jgi:hypothetical protein
VSSAASATAAQNALRQQQEQYNLRLQNHSAQAADAQRRQDPLAAALTAVRDVAESLLAPASSRGGERRVQVQSFRDKTTGKGIRKIIAVDGRPGAGGYAPRQQEAAERNVADLKKVAA